MPEIRVRPTGWEDAALEEKFPLSDMDHIMPKIYCLIVEVFELPTGADKNETVAGLVKGLEFTLSQYPALTGALQMDETTGRMCKTPHSK